MQYFIDVILPIPIERLFTYSITKAEFDYIKSGMRVAVPFGKSKIYTALVHNTHLNPPEVYEAKAIHQVLDESPIVTTYQIKLWSWISNYYMCTMGDVMRAALPGAFLLESETIISLNTTTTINDSQLKDDEFLVFEALHHQSALKVNEISSILDKKNILPVLKCLLEKDAITVEEEIYEKYKPKLVRYVRLNSDFSSNESLNQLLEKLTRAPKQSAIIMAFFSLTASTTKPIKVSELKTKSKASSAQIKTLIDKQILEEYFIKTDRIQYSGEEKESIKTLNKHQENTLNSAIQSFEKHNVTLVFIPRLDNDFTALIPSLVSGILTTMFLCIAANSFASFIIPS